jgi:hypothetical protein
MQPVTKSSTSISFDNKDRRIDLIIGTHYDADHQQTLPAWHMRAPLKRYAMQIFLDIGILVCHHVLISIGICLKERDIL